MRVLFDQYEGFAEELQDKNITEVRVSCLQVLRIKEPGIHVTRFYVAAQALLEPEIYGSYEVTIARDATIPPPSDAESEARKKIHNEMKRFKNLLIAKLEVSGFTVRSGHFEANVCPLRS